MYYLCISIRVFPHCIFFIWMSCSQQEHMHDPRGVSCPHKLPCLLLSWCQQNPTGKHNPLFFFRHSLLHCPDKTPLPFIPTPCPSILTCVLLYLLIYDLISTQCTHSGVWKTLCSHSMEPLSSLNALSSLFSHSAPSSICIPISELSSEEGGPETHLSQIFTNLPLILPADGLAPIL